MKDGLIVRIAGEGLYRVPHDPDLLNALNDLDEQIGALLRKAEADLQCLLREMAALVREEGTRLEGTPVPSDLVLPPEDLSLREAAELFAGEGVIPG